MLSESCSSSFCFMGLSSNPKVFLSDKGGNNVDPELGLLVVKEGCQTFIHEDHHQLIRLKVQERDDQEEGDNKDHHQEEQKQQRNNSIITKAVRTPVNLKLEIPCSFVGSENDDEYDGSNVVVGFKTPTSSDHKIPVIHECPGAPKKTKARLVTKRKACRRIVLDVSKELESLFPMAYVVDLGVNKRVKQLSGTEP